MHSTQTVDLITMLEGEVTLVLDSGAEILLKAHEVLLQRGVVHAWENRSDKTAVWTAVTLGRLQQ
jgi:quercetin dioxygenase-like cupin family protein